MQHKKIKDICLILTTIISILGFGVMLYQNKLQKLQYEREVEKLALEKLEHEKNMQLLQLEKDKYENMLKENNIQLRSSYIKCEVDCIKSLYENLGEDSNLKILSNEITEMFYDSKEQCYLHAEDLKLEDDTLQGVPGYFCPEVIFLEIEVISNRIVRNVNLNFVQISEKNNINIWFRRFSDIKDEEFYQKGENIVVNIGDMNPNDIILIPVVLRYSEDYNGVPSDPNWGNSLLFGNIYVPETISCYDDFYTKILSFPIRDLLHNSLITEYYFEMLG